MQILKDFGGPTAPQVQLNESEMIDISQVLLGERQFSFMKFSTFMKLGFQHALVT